MFPLLFRFLIYRIDKSAINYTHVLPVASLVVFEICCHPLPHACLRAYSFLWCSCMYFQVKLTEGTYENLKLTTPEDLMVASQILEARESNKDFEENDNVPPEDFLSLQRATAKWADRPRGAPGVSELNLDDEIELSKMRADANWSDRDHGAPGVSELDLDHEIELSKQRADEKWSDRPRGAPGVSELDLDFERELSEERAKEKWTDNKIL